LETSKKCFKKAPGAQLYKIEYLHNYLLFYGKGAGRLVAHTSRVAEPENLKTVPVPTFYLNTVPVPTPVPVPVPAPVPGHIHGYIYIYIYVYVYVYIFVNVYICIYRYRY
jgi:hypothetical protein